MGKGRGATGLDAGVLVPGGALQIPTGSPGCAGTSQV